LLAGSRDLFARFDRARAECSDPRVFFKAKRFEQEQRHTKFQDSPYSLEPNLKEAPAAFATFRSSCGSAVPAPWPHLAGNWRAAA